MDIQVTVSLDERAQELIVGLIAAIKGSGTTVTNTTEPSKTTTESAKTTTEPAKPTRRRRTKKGDDNTNGAKAPNKGDTGEQKADAKSEHTVEQVRDTLRKFASDNGPEKAREILDTFEVESVTILFKDCPERVNDFMDAVTG